MRRYKLVDRQPVPLLGSEPEEEVEVMSDLVGGIEIRTKFLGYSTSSAQPPPDLFETMVYANPPPYQRWRYGTWEAAVKGHADIVAQARRQTLRVV